MLNFVSAERPYVHLHRSFESQTVSENMYEEFYGIDQYNIEIL